MKIRWDIDARQIARLLICFQLSRNLKKYAAEWHSNDKEKRKLETSECASL